MNNQYRPLSTNKRGPRSRAGKAAVALNHLKHGLDAAQIALPSEDRDDWSRFHDDVLARFEPDGAIELGLASRIAEMLWRLRRVARAEQQSISVAQTRRDALAQDPARLPPDSAPVAEQPAALGFYGDVLKAEAAASRHLETLPVLMPDDHMLDTIVRYEAHLSRMLKHALHELEALQDRRRGVPTPLARIDIN